MKLVRNISRESLFRVFANVMLVFMVFLLPDILWDVRDDFNTSSLHYARPFTFLVVFYVNYLYIIPKMLSKKHNLLWAIVCNTMLCFVASVILIGAHHIDWMSSPDKIPLDVSPISAKNINHINEPWHFKLIGFFSHDFVYMILTIGLSYAIRMSEIWSKLEKEQAAMNVERKDRELASLKSQLNPHFLFNTLNNIYALISIDQHKAQRAVHELSQLLRYMLYENKEKTIPLECELRFVKNYIELMKLRLTSSTQLKVDVNETDGVGLQIAPFMFISIVENAFKHGVCADKPSFVDISIVVTASTVKCVVKNSYFPQKKSNSEASGIGIDNLKKQISILYPNRHTFEVFCDNVTYTTILEIKL